MRKYSQHNNDERTHFFKRICLSHFIRNGCERVAKGLCGRDQLENEQTATYWPTVPLSLAALLSRSAGLLNQGSWGPIALCWLQILSTASYIQLDWLQTHWTYLWPRVISLFDFHLLPVSVASAPNSTHPQSRLYTDIFDRMHLFLDWRLDRRSICYNWRRSSCQLRHSLVQLLTEINISSNWPSRLGQQNTPTLTQEKNKTQQTRVQDITLKNLMVKLQ